MDDKEKSELENGIKSLWSFLEKEPEFKGCQYINYEETGYPAKLEFNLQKENKPKKICISLDKHIEAIETYAYIDKRHPLESFQHDKDDIKNRREKLINEIKEKWQKQ